MINGLCCPAAVSLIDSDYVTGFLCTVLNSKGMEQLALLHSLVGVFVHCCVGSKNCM